MSKKNNVFAGLEHRYDLVTGKPARYSFRNPPRPVKPVDLEFGNIGAHPGSAGDRGRLGAGSLARATGFLMATGFLLAARIGIHRI
jgi:hypothetical protein